MGTNRAFVYGDLLIETVAIIDGRIRHAPLHVERISRSAALLGFELPGHWDADYFDQLVTHKCPEKNMRARLLIYRSGNGFYLPNSSEVQFQIEYWSMPKPKHTIENLGIFSEQYKSCSPLSNLKSGNALVYVLASSFAAANNLDDALILNQHGRIAEATSSNIFWVAGGVLHTPPLSEGPVAGVMREVVKQVAAGLGLPVKEAPLDTITLLGAEECFLTNAIQEIVSVKQFGSKTFTTAVSELLRPNL